MRRAAPLALGLVAASLLVFGRTAGHGFVVFDDPLYVTENPHVLRGLTVEGTRWALREVGHAGNWHPLTWLSHMLDIELWGPSAGAHHAVSVALHALAGAVLLLALSRLLARSPEHAAAAPWIAAFAAALVALHPMRVESVAWISERKDVLGELFLAAALLAHARHAERPAPWRYGLVLAAQALGLMSKPTLVTLPLLLLLIDLWPLRRWGEGRGYLFLVEKVPMLALSAAAGVVAWVAQERAGAIGSLPLAARLGNAVVWCGGYAAKFLWPAKLAVFYPFPFRGIPGWKILLSGGAVAAVTLLALGARRRRPWLAVGWLWYLVSLVPVIGLVHVGMQAAADRYTSIPHVGLALIAACGLHDLVASGRLRVAVAAAAAAALVAACAAAAWVQAGTWRDSETLFARAAATTADNFLAHHALGLVQVERGSPAAAEEHYRLALEAHGDYGPAHRELGRLLVERGATEEGVGHILEAIRLDPRDERARVDLGAAWLRLGEPERALECFEEAARLDGHSFEAWNQMGVALDWLGETARAAEAYARAGAIRPDRFEPRLNLASALLRSGDAPRAARAYREALSLRPDSGECLLGLGLASLLSGDRETALEQQRRLLVVDPGRAERLRDALEAARPGRVDSAR